MPFRRPANQRSRYDWATKPSGQTDTRFRYSGIDLPRGEDLKDGREIGRAPALAGPARLFVRRKWPPGERIGHSIRYDQVPFWESRLSRSPGGSFNPVETQTHGADVLRQRCRLSGIVFVISPPPSTSRADERNVGEEIERGATSIAPRSLFSPANVAEQAGPTDARTSSQGGRLYRGVAIVISLAEMTTHDDRARRGPNTCTKHHFGIATQVIFPAEVTTFAQKIRTTAAKLDRAPRWRRGLD